MGGTKPAHTSKFWRSPSSGFSLQFRMSGGDMWTHNNPVDGPHSGLIKAMPAAQEFLAPTLLLLCGEVEKTGFYEKLANRRSIMIVLRYLSKLKSHSDAFRGVASLTDNNLSFNSQFIEGVSTSFDTSEYRLSHPHPPHQVAIIHRTISFDLQME